MSVNQALSGLNTGSSGLSSEEAGKRLSDYGPNELTKHKGVSPLAIFLEQFKSFLIIILLVAVALSAVLGETVDAILIMIIVVFAGLLGFVQEYRAEKAMEALNEMAAPTAAVIREGREARLASRELVPGDIIILRTGDRIPADGRLVEAYNLKTEEAPLTGESTAVDKSIEPVSATLPVAERTNMIFTGTTAVYGRGTAVITATGMSTEFGKIAAMLQQVKQERTPLQVNLDRVGKYIGVVALFLCFALAGVGIIRGHEVLEMVIWGVSLAVAAVPEALPAVVVISLAFGVRRMVKRNALIRRLPAVETLGSTDYICSDKTGTLTQDRMTVRRIWVSGRIIEVTGRGYEPEGSFTTGGKPVEPAKDESLLDLLKTGLVCNDAGLVQDNGKWTISGDPTEGSLIVAAAKAGLDTRSLYKASERIGEIPFTSERKRMTTINREGGKVSAHSKGAVEIILASCSSVLENGASRALNDEYRTGILAVARDMASDALRVLGMAYKPMRDAVTEDKEAERGMVFLGLTGIIDPPRPEAREAIAVCTKAGIRSVMITGDHKVTATAIARELGLLKEGMVITGAELDGIDDAAFDDIVEEVEIYARVSPSHKLRVVGALTSRRHVVAMTGDGINDAPALKKADIGIAMGITGTDVTKEAADMVLIDDNFASIVAAVEEGRIIFANIKKYLMYLLSSNTGEILLMAGAILLGPLIGLPEGAIPLIAVQILFVNLVTDGLPAIALALDPADPDVMQQKPRPRSQGIFTRPVVALMLTGGIWSAIVNLGIFSWVLNSGRGLVEAQAMCFITLILVQFFKAYNFRSDRQSVFRLGIFKNRWLNLSILGELALLAGIIYLPLLQEPFRVFPLSGLDWVLAVGASATVFPVLELVKMLGRKCEKSR
ncbi:MAG: cation-translocating P-type ATPase [Dehalococcoidaceae bacterium]|nr:cation-translocating P-type ATPase [Dehalococcoidaceae bacterium]